ncbi:hypothetical protein ABBQ38_005727 [Trebouxia sp. C0009 RCD-2024]
MSVCHPAAPQQLQLASPLQLGSIGGPEHLWGAEPSQPRRPGPRTPKGFRPPSGAQADECWAALQEFARAPRKRHLAQWHAATSATLSPSPSTSLSCNTLPTGLVLGLGDRVAKVAAKFHQPAGPHQPAEVPQAAWGPSPFLDQKEGGFWVDTPGSNFMHKLSTGKQGFWHACTLATATTNVSRLPTAPLLEDSAGFGVTKASDWSVGRKYLHMLCVALSSGSPASTVTAAALSAPGGSEPQRAPPRVRKRAVVKVEGLQAVVLLQLSYLAASQAPSSPRAAPAGSPKAAQAGWALHPKGVQGSQWGPA